MRRKRDYLKPGFHLALLLFQLGIGKVFAQHDSLILKNKDVIVGEIKSLDKGVLVIETDYSDNDFMLEWSGVKEVYSKNIFLVTLTDGSRINGSLQTDSSKKNVIITTADAQKTSVLIDDIVYLKGLESDFWSRLNANVDIGLSFTKANNLQQFDANCNASYIADRWQLDGYFTIMKSSQDSITATKRTDAGIGFKYFLPKDWFAATSLNFLSNTEQALKLRSTGKIGGGKFLIHTNKTYWTLGAGVSFNNERFTNEVADQNSVEAYGGTELNMFDVGDLNLLGSLFVYPSLTESGRWRSDLRFDAKYDLFWELYVRAGVTLNYDNQPAVEGNDLDYILSFGFGWEL